MDLRGRVVVGLFGGVRSVVYGPNHSKAGQVVAGNMQEVVVVIDDGDDEGGFVRLSFFQEGFKGLTPMARALAKASPQEGDLVAVAFRSRAKVSADGSRAFVNEDAVGVEVLEVARPRLAAVPSEASDAAAGA